MADGSKSSRTKVLVAVLAASAAVLVLGSQVAKLRALASSPVVLTPSATAAPSAPIPTPSAPPATYSNIYKYDYVGPETCGGCHEKNYALWKGHPHSRMNRNASAGAVVGDFDDAHLDYGGTRALFSKADGEYLITLYDHDEAVRQYRVTRVVGSRFVQMYVGKQVRGPEPLGDPVYADEVKMPFAYWIARKEWFPQTYDENVNGIEWDEKGHLTDAYQPTRPASGHWRRTCIKCHNTYPYVLRFDAAYKEELVGFPTSDVTLHKKPLPLASYGPSEIDPSELVTMGISCESCHFGGREHATTGAAPSFLPKGEGLETKVTAEGTGESPYAINSICHQCHDAGPQGPLYPDGSASWNAREASDIITSSCRSKVACIDCHNPHQAGPTRPDAPDNPAQIAACVGCHTRYKDPDAALAHGKHQKAESASCLDCHMPRMVHGLAGMTRTHHIGSPTDPKMLASNQPNACNLCHLDKSLTWTVDALASKWGKKVDVAGAPRATEPLGTVWLDSPSPVVRHVAAGAWARSSSPDALAHVLPQLLDPSPPVRMFAPLAIERIVGRPIGPDEYTPWATPEERKKQSERLAATLKGEKPSE